MRAARPEVDAHQRLTRLINSVDIEPENLTALHFAALEQKWMNISRSQQGISRSRLWALLQELDDDILRVPLVDDADGVYEGRLIGMMQAVGAMRKFIGEPGVYGRPLRKGVA